MIYRADSILAGLYGQAKWLDRLLYRVWIWAFNNPLLTAYEYILHGVVCIVVAFATPTRSGTPLSNLFNFNYSGYRCVALSIHLSKFDSKLQQQVCCKQSEASL